MPGWTRKASKNHIAQLERRRSALILYKEFHNYETVAEKMGLHDRSGARKLVMAALADIPREAAEDVRRMEAAHLDHLTAKAAKIASGKQELEAIRTMAGLSERRSKLLGLDAEQKFQVANTHQVLTASPMDRLQLYVNRGTKREHWPAEMQEFAEAMERQGVAIPQPAEVGQVGQKAIEAGEDDSGVVDGEVVETNDETLENKVNP